MAFLFLLLIPLLIALGFLIFGGKKVSGKEFCLHILAQCIVAGISVGLCYWQNTGDLEVWNGVVTKKAQESTSCEHSYSCNCRMKETCSGSGSSRSCSSSEICDTCYEHMWDYDWVLTTSNSERIFIDRVDRQGVRMPSRYQQAAIGDPTAQTHMYTNYIKASPNSLFIRQGLEATYKEKLPKYPIRVYNYHYLDRVIGEGFPDIKKWNKALQKINAKIGSKKQVNIIVVGTFAINPEWGEALEQKWLGGKKNDVVVVLGMDKEQKPLWTHVMAWTDHELFKVTMRDKLLDLPKLELATTLPLIETTVITLYVRKPMADFEYLKAGITPSTTQWVVSMLIGIFISVGLGFYFLKTDVLRR